MDRKVTASMGIDAVLCYDIGEGRSNDVGNSSWWWCMGSNFGLLVFHHSRPWRCGGLTPVAWDTISPAQVINAERDARTAAV